MSTYDTATRSDDEVDTHSAYISDDSESESLVDTQTGTEIADSATVVDTNNESDSYTGSDTGEDTNSDTFTDTNGVDDTDTQTDEDTDAIVDIETFENPCSGSAHAECYGGAPWCFDGDEPVQMLDECDTEGGEQCVETSTEHAMCACLPDQYRRCYGGDVWSYNSCDEMDRRVEACSDIKTCAEDGDTDAYCKCNDAFWNGENCDICDGFNDGDTEHCQCPDDTYIVQSGTPNCWACSPGKGLPDNCTSVVKTDSLEAAQAICPAEFHIPTMEELMSLFSSYEVHEDGGYRTPFCMEDPVCSQIFPEGISLGDFYTSEECDSEGNIYLFGFGGFSICAPPDQGALVLCVAN